MGGGASDGRTVAAARRVRRSPTDLFHRFAFAAAAAVVVGRRWRRHGGGCSAAAVGITRRRPLSSAADIASAAAFRRPRRGGDGTAEPLARLSVRRGVEGATVRTARSFSRIQSIRQIVFVPHCCRARPPSLRRNISQFSLYTERTRSCGPFVFSVDFVVCNILTELPSIRLNLR